MEMKLTNIYKHRGSGSIWITEEKKASVIKKIYHNDEDKPALGSFEFGTFDTSEIYVEDYDGEPTLYISGSIDEAFVSIHIPITNHKNFTGLLSDIIKQL